MDIKFGIKSSFSGKSSAVAIGAFDGLHSGHRKILDKTIKISEDKGAVPTVITFERKFPALNSINEKMKILKELGIKRAILLKRGGEWKDWTAERFVENFLIPAVKSSDVIVGEDFRFGAGRRGTLKILSETYSSYLRVHKVMLEKVNGEKISSSLIRNYIDNGDVNKCRRFLGMRYFFTGKIVSGRQLGRKLGFPTLNFSVPDEKLLPRGIFLCMGIVEGESINSYPGACFISDNKNSEKDRYKTEIHFIKKVPAQDEKVRGAELLDKISDVGEFSSREELSKKIGRDIKKANKILKCKGLT